MKTIDVWAATDVVVPRVFAPGGFVPHVCCLCGCLLRERCYRYHEGTLCFPCHFRLPISVRVERVAAEEAARGES